MPSNFITYPHAIDDPESLLVVNATEEDVETLAVWLSSQDRELNVHFYNNDTASSPWAHNIAGMVKTVLVNSDQAGWDYSDYKHKVQHYSSANPLLNFFTQDV